MPSGYNLAEFLGVGLLTVVSVVAAVAAVFIISGLFQARSLVWREFTAYFLSPIAYVVLVVFLVITGYLFYITLPQLTASGPEGVEFPMQSMLGDQWPFWLVFLVIPPLLTMRLFAEERSTGTLESLMTTPLKDWQVVMSKFVACFAFYLLLWVPTLVYLPALLGWELPPTFNAVWTPSAIAFQGGLIAIVLAVVLGLLPGDTQLSFSALVLAIGGAISASIGGWIHYHSEGPHVFEIACSIDPFPVVSSYLGLVLAGAMFLAIGLLVSSLVRSQLVAFMIAMALSMLFVVLGFWRPDVDTSGTFYQALYFVSVPLHFSRDFCRGLIDSRHVTLYLSVTLFSLFLTVRSLESRRWR